jgi:RNA polymerase sigma-70 factor (ECF subfamily)
MTDPLHVVTSPDVARDDALTCTEPSFESFFRTERARLFGALLVMTGNRAEAEELLQDAFLKVWERWVRVAAMDEPVGFLYRTAMNLYRKRRRRAAVVLRKSVHLLPDVDELAAVETRDEAVRLLGLLTPRERAALVVTAYLGYSTEEAGRLLGIRATTVRVLTGRARATLRETKENSR